MEPYSTAQGEKNNALCVWLLQTSVIYQIVIFNQSLLLLCLCSSKTFNLEIAQQGADEALNTNSLTHSLSLCIQLLHVQSYTTPETFYLNAKLKRTVLRNSMVPFILGVKHMQTEL